MSLTETRPVPGPATEAADTAAAPVLDGEVAGLAGWLTTVDHKRVGRLWIGFAIVALVVGSVTGGILGAERVDEGLTLFDGETFGQVYTFHGEVALFGFLVPLFVGLATVLVPLQVGARAIAFPRLATAAFWTYAVALALLGAAYAANGGPGGGSDVGVDLYLLALGALNVATVAALVPVLTTALALRVPGMTLLRTPLFTWSVVVGGGLTLLTAPVLVARLVGLFVEAHYGGSFPADGYAGIAWFASVPQVFLLTVPAAGIAAEVVPTLTGSRLRRHDAGLVVLGLLGVLGIGAYAQDPSTFDDLLYVGMGLAAVLPALALLGLLGDTLRARRPTLRAPLLLALGAVVQLLLGALAGAALVLEPLELQGTVWEAAQVHYTLYGGAVLGAFAGLWYWSPKLYGVHLGEWAGRAVFALVFSGAILLAAPDLAAGLFGNQPLLAGGPGNDDLVRVLNGISAAGGVVATLGVLVALGDLLGKVVRRQGRPAPADPWGGGTLEWATASPPVPSNFEDDPAPVTSPTPLLDPVPEAAS